MDLIPAFRRQKQAQFCESETSLVYNKLSPRTSRALTQRNPVYKKNSNKKPYKLGETIK